ncbi:MAG: Caulobacter phage CcrSC [Bacteroidota bacterium]
MKNKTINIFGGGTFSHVRNHLALAMPSFGTTAKQLANLCEKRFDNLDVNLFLTKMANSNSKLVTNEDVMEKVLELKKDLNTKIVFFNVGLCDFKGEIGDVESGKYSTRLKTSQGETTMKLTPQDKVLKEIRQGRKDIFLVAFKTTCGATEQEQYLAGLELMKKNSCNLVLANDVKTRVNMIITPEEARYHITTDREEALTQLVDMAFYRSHLSFTRSTVVEGTPIEWGSPLVFSSLREIVNYCVEKNAYKPFNGATVGHFACKIGEKEFLTSIRKTNFNDLHKTGLVKVVTDSSDTVIAYGAKPSVVIMLRELFSLSIMTTIVSCISIALLNRILKYLWYLKENTNVVLTNVGKILLMDYKDLETYLR